MKTKRYHNTRGWGRALSALLALALAVGLVLTVPPLDGFALADETDPPEVETQQEGGALALDEDCSLTLKLSSQNGLGADNTEAGKEERKALEDAAVIDYYKIADAVPVAGYDVYDFRVGSDSPYYDAIKKYVEGIDRFVSREVKGTETYFLFRYEPADPLKAPVDDWVDLMEEIARVCFDGLADPDDTRDYGKVEGKTGTIGDTTEELEPGLYLTVVHGSAGPETIVDRAKRETFTSAYPWYLAQQEEGTDRLYRSIVFTNENIYVFQPQLIALPGAAVLAGTVSEDNPNGYRDTTAGWNYDVEAVLKYITQPHMASLKIRKTVEGTITDPATFVFRVAGTGADNDPYEDLRTIQVDKDHTTPDDIEIAFNGIKAGSTVTVTEELSDASYKLDAITADAPEGSKTTPNVDGRTLTIENIPGGDIVLTVPDPANAGQSVEVVLHGEAVGPTVTVSAANTHNTTTSTSGSVVNVFDPAEAGWTWTKRHYTGVRDENGNIINETWTQDTGKVGVPGQNSGT